MKISSILTITLVTAALTLGSPAFAKRHNKKNKPNKPEPAKVVKREDPAAPFDKNKNGKIDDDEAAAITAAFDANKTGSLKKFDLDHDSKLEKSEISSIHVAKQAK